MDPSAHAAIELRIGTGLSSVLQWPLPLASHTDGGAERFTRAAPKGMARFGWTDRSTDEDEVLVEIKKSGAVDFVPIEVSDPATTSARLASMPGKEGASYRLRVLLRVRLAGAGPGVWQGRLEPSPPLTSP
ncbi:hypothetical protein P3102_24135 [Amycolatopsis sp. QT-25]|uniref:hypothetical protein n=1 Tax=Amycolatopsis sp. QT-25 TaxID=3034022 RepID=UPI0023ED0355|nr:hypothetical protein [Amycolatopsis sp. QT-25]WET77173.1 hypothetical protein P3102_24135 [Amycolatopsis sp. QT-25]